MTSIVRCLVVALGAMLATATAAHADAIKIGILANMGTSEGHHPVDGARLAVEDINKAGGVLGRSASWSSKTCMRSGTGRHYRRTQ